MRMNVKKHVASYFTKITYQFTVNYVYCAIYEWHMTTMILLKSAVLK